MEGIKFFLQENDEDIEETEVEMPESEIEMPQENQDEINSSFEEEWLEEEEDF